MMATAVLVLGYPDDSRATTISEPVVAHQDDQWVAEVLATLGRLRAERALRLDNVLCVGQSCYSYVVFGAMAHVPTAAAVLTVNRSHAITVEVERPHARGEDILVSCDVHGGGFVFYVRDNRLGYEYRCAGALYTIKSDREVPVGTSTLRFEFTKTGHLQGNGALYINDEKVGEAAIPHTLPYYISSEGPGIRGKGPVAMSRSEKDGIRRSGTIKGVMISSADNSEPIPGIGSHVLGTD